MRLPERSPDPYYPLWTDRAPNEVACGNLDSCAPTADESGVMSRADELGRLEQEVGVLIRRVKRVIGERARAVHPDLQPASYLMLTYLATDGPQRSSVVSERFN